MSDSITFSWVKAYSRLADKLLTYKNDRKGLLQILDNVFSQTSLKFPFTEAGEILHDVCPFTVFGCFNKGIKDENRIQIMKLLFKALNIDVEMPTSFEGIPVLSSMNAWFFYGKDKRNDNDISNLWDMFEVAIAHADSPSIKSEKDFVYTYNKVSNQLGIKWNLTMGLYWIRPFNYLNLDERNRNLFINNEFFIKGINSKTLKVLPDGRTYLQMLDACKNAFSSNTIKYKSFPDLSYNAWLSRTDKIEYFPSLSVYNPSISKEQWLALTKDKTVFTGKSLSIMKMFLEQGGESTCAHLSEVYGNTSAYYNMMGSNLANNIRMKTGCPKCIDGDKELIFPIVFLGRHVIEDNKKRYSWKLRPELYKALKEIDLSEIDINKKENSYMIDTSKNTILYGPPGTGKTYNTVKYAVAIIENKSVEDIDEELYADVIERYNKYKEQQLIEFTTFHQSYSYEEFIEGIKPLISENENEGESIQYIIHPGVFKRFCEKIEIAEIVSENPFQLNENPTIWKVSLDGTGDNPIRTECLKKGHIRIGWDEYGEVVTDNTDFSVNGGKYVLNAFINTMQIGDIVMSCYSSKEVDAIGVITGDYEWNNSYDRLKRIRRVNWLTNNIKEDIYKINNETTMTLSTVYKLKSLALADVFNIVNKSERKSKTNTNNRVFIIDEINRGNISKIFGELITLIEPSKRLGQEEEIKVRLPYSQKPFGVPDNVYIVGTMNTADRSIALIDTALRRRFQFIEMHPDPDVLKGTVIDGIDIAAMIRKINQRVEVLCDREHTIGHAYFIPLINNPSFELLANIFKNNIIPLLQEYFYEDYEKIRLVLGDNNKEEQEQFITANACDYSKLFGNTDFSFDDTITYSVNKAAFYNVGSYINI